MRLRLLPFITLVSLGALGAACGGSLDDGPPVPAVAPAASTNLLVNGGFEDGEAPWTYRVQPEWSGFDIAENPVRSGGRSLRLGLRDAGDSTGTFISGAIQELRPADFPEVVSGYYRVDGWNPDGVAFQYLQFVVIVRGANYGDDFDLHEIRFPLAGAPREPFQLVNAKWVFLSRTQPQTGTWVYFDYPLKQAFIDKWGRAPDRWDSIELFLEVRYDGRTAGASGMSADVYFDDMYAGPWLGNPNRP